MGAPEICRELGISTAAFYKWHAKYGGVSTSRMARMKEFGAENARLKKLHI
ncbi:transposase [Polynucleobacter paneuropaeus]|nr:transposase [Polynucleobacter paneuropaeus]